MKRSTRKSRSLHVRVLPGCLAIALGIVAPLASTDARATTEARSHDLASVATALPAFLSDGEKQTLLMQLQRSQRTPPPVPATSIPVTNCDDAGPGSLRDAVSAAADGDTIDMTSLACSKITLTTGAIAIGLNNLTLQGPNVLGLEIDANDSDRALWHLGNGTLTVNDLTIDHGHKYLSDGDLGNPGGACVFSLGSVVLNNTWTKYCSAASNDVDTAVHGGAVYAQLGVSVSDSLVTDSSATSNAFEARGGGIYTPGSLFLIHSTVSRNSSAGTVATGGGVAVGSLRAGGAPGGAASIKYSTLSGNHGGYFGGGAYLTGNAIVGHSTISGNSSCRGGGVYFVHGANATADASLYSSTVSGNAASCRRGAGGVAIFGEDARFEDSTIAFNTAASNNDTKYGAGVRVFTADTLELQNTIIAGNMTDRGSGPEHDDIGGDPGASLTGANNLIFYPSSLVAPSGTLLLLDPMLRGLAANGGSTATHLPNFGSPVIDAGNNASGATVDQRGPGFPRVLGAAADIGSVEFDLSDVIFQDGFD
jgi:hypothetical protein